MKNLTAVFSAFLLVLTMVGCSSTKDIAAPSDRLATEQASAPEATAAVESAEAPVNWFHLDAEDDRFRGISTDKTYETLLQNKQPQKTVVVAVIDGGVDIEHEDLQAVIWTNEDEIPDNGIDDDHNGYIDDVHGWNFIGGPDGQNVDHDTYELTRELARLQPTYKDADPAQLPFDAQAEYAYYQELKKAYTQKIEELKMQYANISTAHQAVEHASSVLKKHLGTGQLTQEQVAALRTDQEDVRQAQALTLRLYEFGITPQELTQQNEYLENALRYGYNLSFDPRPIVGDNYADPRERYYGNNDVIGPDPKHGTIVAGIIAASRDNQLGMEGIAGNVRIMAVRAVPNGDERDKDVANAIRYAVDNGADIINMSFGKAYSPHKDVVDAAVRYADEKGVLLIHAAGNDAVNIDTTANFPNKFYQNDTAAAGSWIEVGASSWEDGLHLVAPFSNYGAQRVDVFAPGVDIYSTTPRQTYDRADGTSMAAPVVTGIAAMLMAYYPDLSASQVRDVVLSSAIRYPNLRVAVPGLDDTRTSFARLSVTGGIANAYAAIKLAEASSQ